MKLTDTQQQFLHLYLNKLRFYCSLHMSDLLEELKALQNIYNTEGALMFLFPDIASINQATVVRSAFVPKNTTRKIMAEFQEMASETSTMKGSITIIFRVYIHASHTFHEITNFYSKTGDYKKRLVDLCAKIGFPNASEMRVKDMRKMYPFPYKLDRAYFDDTEDYESNINDKEEKELKKEMKKEAELVCMVCKKRETKLFRCSRCKAVCYCSGNCQKLDWPEHKQFCCNNKKV